MVHASLLDIEVGGHRYEYEKKAGVSWEVVDGTHHWADVEKEEAFCIHRNRPCFRTSFCLGV